MNDKRKDLEWTLSDQGTWIAEGYMWGYELIRHPTATKELWNLRAWFINADADRPQSAIIGGYKSADVGKWYAQKGEDNERAPFKIDWFDRVYRRGEHG